MTKTSTALTPLRCHHLLGLLLLWSLLCFTTALADANHASHSSIPRSTHNSHYDRLRQAATSSDTIFDEDTEAVSLLDGRPPWNPSPSIGPDGFCHDIYTRIPGDWENEVLLGGKHQNPLHMAMVQVKIRQVPGDGNCLFHSISTCMAQATNGTQLSYPHDLGWLYRHSASLRQQAVECLRQKRKLLFLQGNEYLRAHELVEAAAAQYGISAKEYCDLMQQDSYWGGGPEIVALCNVLKRPIHVYELATTPSPKGMPSKRSNGFVLRRMACFGSPKYDKEEPFHILSADSRFPDIAPGKQTPTGNHFLAVFPIAKQQAELEAYLRKKKRLRKLRQRKRSSVRGGSSKQDFAARLEEFDILNGDDDDDDVDMEHMAERVARGQQLLKARQEYLREQQENEANQQRFGKLRAIKSYVKGFWARWVLTYRLIDDEVDP